jgi:hypothetical protein
MVLLDRAIDRSLHLTSNEEIETMGKYSGKKEFSIGGMWEGPEWSILFDYHVFYEDTPCKHCSELKFKTKEKWELEDSTYFICPRVVVAHNEGGYNSTGVCLDCIIEQTNDIEAWPRPKCSVCGKGDNFVREYNGKVYCSNRLCERSEEKEIVS